MKTFALCAVCGVVAFVAVQYQMTGQLFGLYGEPAPAPPPPPAKLKFPDALAVLCRGTGVPQATAFHKSTEAHPTIVLRSNGTVHPWNERLQPGWQAESVEETELVIIVPPQQRSLLQVVTYADKAPPIRRYQYDLDVRVLEARTAKPLGHKRFQSIARTVRPQEVWALTELGDPVPWRDVYHWVQALVGHGADR